MDFKKKMKKFFTLTRKADGGFTLVELVVVIAILAILAGITVPAYGNYVENAKMATDQQTLATMNTAFTVACMDNGEYDMTALPFTPTASNLNTGVTVSHYNETFQGYFGGGAFQYYDKLYFNSSKGIFEGNTIAALIQIMKDAWNGSSFGSAEDGGEAVLEQLLGTFDMIGGYFAEGFSMEQLLSGAPDDVKEAFNLGAFNLTDEEIMEKYCPEYAALATAEEKAAWLANEANQEKINTIKGNAYVLHMANDAAGKDGATVLTDVNKFVEAIQDPASDEEILAYYKSLPGVDQNATLEEAKQKLAIAGAGIDAGTVVAMVNKEMTNESGISTLGSMYALAAGYMNSEYYEEGQLYIASGNKPANELELDYSSFSTFMQIVQMSGNFQDYCNDLGATDLDAYLGFMDSLSTGNVDMEDSDAFVGQLEDIWGNISN